jgi:hypothetical protein
MRLASERDDEIVRALLRENSMPSWVEISIEREPSFFQGTAWLGREWAVLSEEAGDIVGMYSAAMRRVHVSGRPELLGYLGGLRVRGRHRHRIRHLRAGYASIRSLAPAQGTLPWWFTVIAEGNAPARRLLEAGLPGLPPYQHRGNYVTHILPASRGRRLGLWRRARHGEAEEIAAFHNQEAARYQFSPVLTGDAIERIGLDSALVHERAGTILGAVVLWDQRAFKQVVVQRYRKPLSALLPFYNLYAYLARRVALPPAGEALSQTFLAFLTVAEEVRPQFQALLSDALSHCRTPAAALGMSAQAAEAVGIEAFKPIRYPARVYSVAFDEAIELDSRPVQPEAALL